jgi:hypothetical protein
MTYSNYKNLKIPNDYWVMLDEMSSYTGRSKSSILCELIRIYYELYPTVKEVLEESIQVSPLHIEE